MEGMDFVSGALFEELSDNSTQITLRVGYYLPGVAHRCLWGGWAVEAVGCPDHAAPCICELVDSQGCATAAFAAPQRRPCRHEGLQKTPVCRSSPCTPCNIFSSCFPAFSSAVWPLITVSMLGLRGAVRFMP